MLIIKKNRKFSIDKNYCSISFPETKDGGWEGRNNLNLGTKSIFEGQSRTAKYIRKYIVMLFNNFLLNKTVVLLKAVFSSEKSTSATL